MPEHGYLTDSAYGSGGLGDRGFRVLAESCVAASVPENGFLDSTATDWQCNRAYRAIEGDCVAVDVPVNAYLASASNGSGWKCERGFRVVSDACAVVEVLENAHLDLFGNGWECDRPCRKTWATALYCNE